jgi:hypothetical protein
VQPSNVLQQKVLTIKFDPGAAAFSAFLQWPILAEKGGTGMEADD